MSTTVGPSRASLSAEAFASLGSMEGLYELIVEIQYIKPLSPEAFASFGSMEGLVLPTTPFPAAAPTTVAAPAKKKAESPWPGYVLATVAAVAAYLIHSLPFPPFTVIDAGGARNPISAAILAIVIGLVIRNLLPVSNAVLPGCKSIVKRTIPIAIVLTGAGMNLMHLSEVGVTAFVITILCIFIALAASYYLGRMLGIGSRTAMLIGAGTAICGNSAIVAVAPLLDADDQDLVLSVGTVNLFGLVAMLACPLIGGLLHLSNEAFGIWSGTTIHAVPQVVAAGFAYSHDAGTLATLVKLVRVTLLAPLVAGLAIIYARRHSADTDARRNVVIHYARFVPWFVWGFVVFAVFKTLGLIPTLDFHLAEVIVGTARNIQVPLADVLKVAESLLLTLAMAAMGLELNMRLLAGVGGRALATGLAASIVVGGASLAMVELFV